MISPAFFVASKVGFHVEFSHSMYSLKWPYSTPISCTRVTGPSVYWRSSWARALSGSEGNARHMDRIIGLIIFYAPVVMYLYSANTRIKPNLSRVFRYFYAKQKITPIHYYHDYSSVEARFCSTGFGVAPRHESYSSIARPNLLKCSRNPPDGFMARALRYSANRVCSRNEMPARIFSAC